MKGIVFNLLEGFISDNWGEDAYEEVLGMCPVHSRGPFVGPSTYPDSALMTMVAMACQKLGVTVPVAVHLFGKYCFPRLAGKFPLFLEGHTHPVSFLKIIDNVIHVEVKKLFKDAEPPRIIISDAGPGVVHLHYESKRKLCALATGLLEGCADYFHTPVQYHHIRCMADGHPECEFEVVFGQTREQAA